MHKYRRRVIMDINSKIIGHVYETYDYDAFKFLMRNREPDHYKQIAESIKRMAVCFHRL